MYQLGSSKSILPISDNQCSRFIILKLEKNEINFRVSARTENKSNRDDLKNQPTSVVNSAAYQTILNKLTILPVINRDALWRKGKKKSYGYGRIHGIVHCGSTMQLKD